MVPNARLTRAGANACAVALSAVLWGCSRAPSPAVAPLVRPADRAGVEAAVARWVPDRALEGRGLLRLIAGGEEVPTLNARFSVFGLGGATLILRPGMLPPVLQLWSGSAAWSLLLPRQRLFAEARDPGAGDDEMPAAAVGRLAVYLFSPQTLARDLDGRQIVPHEASWLMRGTLGELSGRAHLAEVWVDPAQFAVSRWSLLSETGESMIRVAYEPPFAGAGYKGTIRFLVPALNVQGSLEIRELRPSDRDPGAPPEPPGDWERLALEEVPGFLRHAAGGAGEE